MPIPEKDIFTLDEIVDRWKHARVDHATLLKFATEDLLVFSVYIRDLGSHSSTQDTPRGTVTTEQVVAFSFRAVGYSRPAIQYLKADDSRRILESRPGERVAVRGHYNIPERTKESGLGHLQAPYFTKEDLLVSRIERDRFERMHKIPLKPPLQTRAWQWLSDQATHRVLTMFFGWIAAILTGIWAVWLWLHQPSQPAPAPPNHSLNRTLHSMPSFGQAFHASPNAIMLFRAG